jgi:hypothetical protein
MDGMPSFANPANLEREWDEETLEVAADANPLDFLCAIFRDPRQPMSRRMRAAIEATPYFHPKLSATAIIPGGEGFARRLGEAIERSRTKLIEHRPRAERLLSD